MKKTYCFIYLTLTIFYLKSQSSLKFNGLYTRVVEDKNFKHIEFIRFYENGSFFDAKMVDSTFNIENTKDWTKLSNIEKSEGLKTSGKRKVFESNLNLKNHSKYKCFDLKDSNQLINCDNQSIVFSFYPFENSIQQRSNLINLLEKSKTLKITLDANHLFNTSYIITQLSNKNILIQYISQEPKTVSFQKIRNEKDDFYKIDYKELKEFLREESIKLNKEYPYVDSLTHIPTPNFIITSYTLNSTTDSIVLYPNSVKFDIDNFYSLIKEKGFERTSIYMGKSISVDFEIVKNRRSKYILRVDEFLEKDWQPLIPIKGEALFKQKEH